MKEDTYSDKVKLAILTGNYQTIVEAFKEWRLHRHDPPPKLDYSQTTYNHDEALMDEFKEFKTEEKKETEVPYNGIIGNPEPLPF